MSLNKTRLSQQFSNSQTRNYTRLTYQSNKTLFNNNQLTFEEEKPKAKPACTSTKVMQQINNSTKVVAHRPLSSFTQLTPIVVKRSPLIQTCLSANVSRRTQVVNKKIQEQINFIEEYNRQNDDMHDPKRIRLLQADGREVFKAVEQDCQILQYKLKRLVCNSERDAHVVLQQGIKLENFVIVPKTYMFFKTSVNQHTDPPGTLNISYVQDSQEKIDLKICYSNAGITEPTDQAGMNSKVYLKKQKKVVFFAPPGKDQFDQPWLYFSCYSNSGCTVSLQVIYQDDERKMQRDMLRDREYQACLVDFKAIENLRKKMDQKNEQRLDIVERNKKLLFQRSFDKQKIQQRTQELQQRKQSQDQYRSRYKLYESMKWHILKEKKKELLEFNLQKSKTRRNVVQWLTNIKVFYLVKRIQKEFAKKTHNHYLSKARYRVCKQIQIFWRRKQQNQALTLDKKNLQKIPGMSDSAVVQIHSFIRLTTSFNAQVIQDPFTCSAYKLFLKLLQDNSQLLSMINLHINFVKKIRFIQKRALNRLQINKLQRSSYKIVLESEVKKLQDEESKKRGKKRAEEFYKVVVENLQGIADFIFKVAQLKFLLGYINFLLEDSLQQNNVQRYQWSQQELPKVRLRLDKAFDIVVQDQEKKEKLMKEALTFYTSQNKITNSGWMKLDFYKIVIKRAQTVAGLKNLLEFQ